MKRTIFGSVILAVVTAAVLIGLGLFVFNAGVAQGLAESGKLVAPAAGSAAGMPYAWYGYPHAWGFGWGLFGCLVPLLLILVFFGFLRRLFWFGRWGPGWHHLGRRYWRDHPAGDKGYPPFFDDWHRRAHGEPDEEDAKDSDSG